MKLHINVDEKSKGLVFKKKYWAMDSQVELSDEEKELLDANPEIKKLIIASGTFTGNFPIDCTVGMLVKGMKESAFDSLANQSEFEARLRDGCSSLKAHLDRLREVSAGPKTIEF